MSRHSSLTKRVQAIDPQLTVEDREDCFALKLNGKPFFNFQKGDKRFNINDTLFIRGLLDNVRNRKQRETIRKAREHNEREGDWVIKDNAREAGEIAKFVGDQLLGKLPARNI
jgi:hypothetical protein